MRLARYLRGLALAGILLGLVVATLLGRGCELAADAVAPGDVVRADVDTAHGRW